MKETGQLRAWNVIQAELWSPLSVCIRRLQVQLRQTEHVHRGHHRNMQRLDAESWQLSPRQEYMVICCPPGMPQLCPLTLQLSPRSGADRSWESQAHRSTEPGTATLIPTATMSWSPAPVYSIPQPCYLGWTQEGGMWFGLLLRIAMNIYTGPP